MATPAGTGPLALLDLPDPCVLGTGDDVAAYALAARLLTPPDAPAEWGEPEPVLCLDLRAALGSRFDLAGKGLADLHAQANRCLAQAQEASGASCTLSYSGGTITCVVSAQGAAGPFSFVISVDAVTAQILRGS